MTTELTLMAVGAHADDIELNAGGTLAKYRDRGYAAAYVMATNNMAGAFHWRNADGSRGSSEPGCRDMMERRRSEAAAAAAFYGADPVFLDHPQRHAKSGTGMRIELRYGAPCPEGVAAGIPTILTAHEDPDSVRRLAETILRRNPEAVLTHGPIMQDLEHVATSLLVTKAYRQAAEAGFEGMLLYWADISPSLFGPFYNGAETAIDITDWHARKLQAIGLHASQMPDPKALDFRWDGLLPGSRHTEAFILGDPGLIPDGQSAFATELARNRKALART